MGGTYHLRDWKDAGESFEDTFSKLSLVRDSFTTRHKEQPRTSKDSFKKLEEEVKEIKTALSASCEIVEKLREENERLEKRLHENIAQENMKIKYKKELESEYNILSRSKVCSAENELLKENTKMRYRALRNIVQVKFFYEPKESNTLNGFVFNKTHLKIVPFSINLSTKSPEEVKDKILKCMEQILGSGSICGDFNNEDD